MASDPGRQVFKDQVQTHGFMFLDDYLDNIVSGGKADPLIELVKTPGRKKAIARKPKLTFSKLANSTIFEENTTNENQPPANSFQAALPKVQAQQVVEEQKALKMPFASNPPMSDNIQRTPFAPIQPMQTSSHTTTPTLPLASVHPIGLQQPMEQSSSEQNDLSIIAEDEEPSERSRPSISNTVKPLETSIVDLEPVSEAAQSSHMPSSESGKDASQQDMDITTTSSVDTFHSIPLNSPPRRQSDLSENPKPLTAVLVDLEDSKEPSSEHPVDGLSGLLPTSSATEIQDYLMADTHEEDAHQKTADKPVVPSFPSLPDPGLRKSTRQPSINAVMQGSATPGAPVGGKRKSSWLMKAREIKALEAPVKKPIVSAFTLNAPTIVPESNGTSSKRKSGDMLSENPLVAEKGERHSKVAKFDETETLPPKSEDLQPSEAHEEPDAKMVFPQSDSFPRDDSTQPEGVFDQLKKTVEGLGIRTSKMSGKSIGGGAATALAEARAAAEARVAERDRKEEEITMAMGLPSTKADFSISPRDKIVRVSAPRQNEGRLSISDLFPTDTRVKEKHKAPEKPFLFTPSFVPTSAKKVKEAAISRDRTSTTPLHSPQPKSRTLPPAPVFNKPPPVFVPPVPASASTISSASVFSSAFDAPSSSKYTMPPLLALAFASRTASPASMSEKLKPAPLTAQSTVESVESDIFDRNDSSAWVPSTQDTDYTDVYESQLQPQTQICDEDDSWPVDEKLAAGVQWSYGESKEDSMTWSTLPSQSQRADTGPMSRVSLVRENVEAHNEKGQTSDPQNVDMDHDQDAGKDFERRDLELEDIIMESSKPTVALVELKVPRSQSQLSMASSESSHSQPGFLTQASRLLNSALGKKKQPEVKKVLQMAASAAKKQQEEADKKAARLKEMENRRQVALQRKAEEEKAKALEEEHKLKEESERRKKEREDMTDKRSLKPSTSKRDEEANKKRKVETEKKQEIKKPALLGKSHLKTALKQPSTSNLNHSFAFGSSAQPAAPAHVAELSSSLQKGKAVAQQQFMDDEVSQPSQFVQSQMAARVKAHIEAEKPKVPLVASESIELPDINSEYSDSEDEDRVRTFDPPEWAQSPDLRTALEKQSTINPDDIFGAVRPLKMEEIFKTRTSRFRARSSSANWTGTDRLTLQEEKDYARRMGFK